MKKVCKILLLTITIAGTIRAEYDYNSPNYSEKLTSTGGDINSLEQTAFSSSEEYRNNNYLKPHNTADNSQAVPHGYDYGSSGELDVAGSGLISESGSLSKSIIGSVSNSDSDPLHSRVSKIVPLPLQRENSQSEIYPPASYSFNYAVNDVRTGDIKEHSETREGYKVRGSYSIVDPDGYKRTVTYMADNVNGFNAIVNRVPYTFNIVDTPLPLLTDPAASGLGSVKHNNSEMASRSQADSKSSLNSRSGPKSDFEDSYVKATDNRETVGGHY